MSQTKLLLVGEFSQNIGMYCYADSFFQIISHFEEFECERFNNKYNYFLWLPSSLSNRVCWIVSFFNNFLANLLLVFKLCVLRPDTVFFIKAENISYRVTRWCKKFFGCRVVIFYPDSPFAFYLGNSNSNVLRALEYTDIFFYWNQLHFHAIKSAGAKVVCYFPFFPDIDFFLDKPKDLQYEYDVCFVGAWDKKRENLLTFLVKSLPDLRVCIIGPMWQEYLSTQHLLRRFIKKDSVTFIEMQQVFWVSKICINIFKAQNEDCHNMRTFEIPASHSFMLAEYSKDQDAFLEEGVNYVSFLDASDMTSKIGFYLSCNSMRENISNNAFLKVKNLSLRQLLSYYRAVLRK